MILDFKLFVWIDIYKTIIYFFQMVMTHGYVNTVTRKYRVNIKKKKIQRIISQ